MEEGNDKLMEEEVKITLKKVYTSLKQRGYDPISQLSGYLISNDLGYISNYKNARNELSKLDRNIIIELLLKEYLKWNI